MAIISQLLKNFLRGVLYVSVTLTFLGVSVKFNQMYSLSHSSDSNRQDFPQTIVYNCQTDETVRAIGQTDQSDARNTQQGDGSGRHSIDSLQYLNQRIVETKRQKSNTLRLLNSEIINKFDIHFRENLNRSCSTFDPEVIIVVPSYCNNFRERLRVRKSSSGNFASSNVTKAILVFFVGLPDQRIHHDETQTIMENLTLEMRRHGDIILTETFDRYQYILLKHLAMLKWVLTFCPKGQFVIRIDDDISLNMRQAVQSMRRYHTQEANFILGKRRDGDHPYRDEDMPHWYVSKEEFEPDTFPPYVLGGAIGYPVTTVRLLYAAAQRIQTVWLDDVFITGVCASALGIPLYNDKSFQFSHGRRRQVG